MPTYFFDTYNTNAVIPDHEGRVLPDLDTARMEAIKDSRELIAIAIFRAENIMVRGISVRRDVSSDPVFVLPFSEVINGLRS